VFLLSYSVDPFSKKDWYDIKAPSVFSVRNIGKTLVSRTQGTRVCFSFILLVFFFVLRVCVCDLLSSTSIHFPACLRVYDLSCYCFIICCCIEKNCLAYIFAVEFLVR